MELFIPSLLVLLIAGLLSFLIIPRLSVPIVLIISLIILVIVMRNHYSVFYSEYRYQTWTEQVKAYAPYVVIGVLIIFIFSSISFILQYKSAPQGGLEIPEVAPLPSASSATNPVTSVINSAINGASNIAKSVQTTVTNAVNNVTKPRANNGQSSYNLTSLMPSANKNKSIL